MVSALCRSGGRNIIRKASLNHNLLLSCDIVESWPRRDSNNLHVSRREVTIMFLDYGRALGGDFYMMCFGFRL